MNTNYSKQVKLASISAVATSMLLILLKSIAWWQTNSVSILTSISDSLLDMLVSFMNLLILRFALMPPDTNHSFGHGKAESLASLIQATFILGSAIFILLHSFYRLNSPQVLNNGILAIWIILISTLCTFILVLYQKKVIKETDSPAIKADCLHYQTDLLMNIALLFSLFLSISGIQIADPFFAILITIYIIFNAGKMMIKSVGLLLDQALPENEVKTIQSIIEEEKNIISFHDLKTRRSGAVRFIQFHLELDDTLSFLESHKITDNLEQRLKEQFTYINVIIHTEPTSVVKYENENIN